MEYNKQIEYMIPGDEVEGFYMLKSAAVKTANNGRPYLNAVLSDVTGMIDAKLWDYNGGIDANDAGSIIKIRGRVDEYKGSAQMTIQKIRHTNEEDSFDIQDIIPAAPIDSYKELEYVQQLVSTIQDDDYRAICEKMLDRHITKFARLPAAKTVHHAFLSGLLMHTSNMLKTADFLASNIYSDTVDRSLLLAGTLLHDFAKEREYLYTEYGLINDFSAEGLLIGHLVLGAEEIEEVGNELSVPHEKTVLLKHMILSHHGQPEYGAAVKPCIAESELLSYIDMIDSRMEIYAENYKNMENGELSQKNIFSLDKRIYRP